jgi:hypothetical protein
MVLSAEKKILSTENEVRPNRDDNDHVLYITINVDSSQSPMIQSPVLFNNLKEFPQKLLDNGLFSELSAVASSTACYESFTFSFVTREIADHFCKWIF